MASIYPRAKSPFWWIKYRSAKDGQIVQESTGFRRDDREQSRKAKQLCALRTSEELDAPLRRSGEDWAWVDGFLCVKYSNSHLTLIRYQAAWAAVSAFLKERRVHAPRNFRRELCFDYMTWRLLPAAAARHGLRVAKHNTALLELKCLSAVMMEAVSRGLIVANPCLQLGIKRKEAKQKPRISEAEIAIIEARLAVEKDEVLQISWDIAMRHARRLSETCVPLDEVDLERGTITFRNKGGQMRTKLLHPELAPLFARLKAEGRSHAFDLPKNFSKKWIAFFRRCGLGHISFHSTRVTVVNMLADAGVDSREARDFVDHSSVIVHSIYLRDKPERQRGAVNALSRNRSPGIPGSP